MEPICDGSGREQYYEWSGRQWLLCETLEPHRHCNKCSLPIGIGSTDYCYVCVMEDMGVRVHNQTGYVRETQEHFDTHSPLANLDSKYSPWPKESSEERPDESDPSLLE